ncbi:MAG: inositol monophosphatase [Micrococcaceae bacterium]|nr:inositol monophosphatase [Micrococcaceae bacterium]
MTPAADAEPVAFLPADLDTSLSDAELAAALVRNAGWLALQMRREGLQGEQKTSVSDVVTAADRAAERYVLGQLERCRPEDGILGEEGASREGSSGRIWVIDPVDGTYNFLSGSTYWCSALALQQSPDMSAPLAEAPESPAAAPATMATSTSTSTVPVAEPAARQRVLLGAVFQPEENKLWLGGVGLPATLNGEPMPGPRDEPVNLLSAATYLDPLWLGRPSGAGPWTAAALLPATLRMNGSGSCDLARVADGGVGCWFQHSCPDWDWLPGKALVEASGGSTAVVEVNGLTWFIAGGTTAVRQLRDALSTAANVVSTGN